MLSSVKNWWGGASTNLGGVSPTNQSNPEAAQQKVDKDEQKPPATARESPEVADSTSTKETEGQQKDAPKELLNTAKDIGAYIYTFGKRATTTVTSKAKQLATAPNIVEEFDRQQREFVSSQTERRARAEAAVPPWVGYENEDQLREQILALSKDTRNFLRSPPQGANFAFDLEACSSVAMATLEVDENLKKMRFDLVPKRVKEAEFWRNYFYRVSLIRQSSQLSALAKSNAAIAAACPDSASTSSDAGYEKVSPPPPQQQQKSSPASSSRNSPAVAARSVGDDVDDNDGDDPDCGDFASSELANQQPPAQLSNVERQRIGGGAVGILDSTTDDWEGELQRELKEFELVNSADSKPAAVDDELEREIMAELDDEAK